jgi:hypothetical protein
MGLACPVCEIPHQDATHLANHLAFTAMTHGDDHEAWLDDHVPEWSEYGEADLADEVTDLAPEAEYDQVFEDTVRERGGVGGHQHDHAHDAARDGTPAGVDPEAAVPTGGGELDEAARAVLDEARALTAEMFDGDDGTAGERDKKAEESDGADTDGDDAEPDD